MGKVEVGNHIIRMAEIADIPFIMDFLDKHWEKGCLLSRDRAYFEYEHVVDGRVNFVVASHKETGSIDAVNGLIQCSKKEPYDAFGVLWVCKPKSGTKFLGMAINDHIAEVSGVRALVGVGLRADTGAKIIDSFYGVELCELGHYYRLAERDSYTIAYIKTPHRMPGTISDKKLIPIPTMRHLQDWFDFNRLPDIPMYKDEWYVEHRYFNHPYYRFCIWGIEESPGNIIGLLVGRVVNHGGSSALRIMDYIGPNDALEGIGGELDLIAQAGGMEYIDFCCTGIPRDNMENAGFVLRDNKDPNIIPNHFEPFEQRNVGIISTGYWIKLFKGDGDQGRPKLLRPLDQWRG